MDYMDPNVLVLKKADKLNLSIYISLTTFYIKLKETWLCERDLDAPNVISEPGGK